MPFVEVCTGTALIRVVSVHGHVAAVLVIHAVGLICGPYKLLDTVSLTNINEQVDECGIGLCIDCVRLFGVTGDLNRDCAIVVRRVRGAPRAVFLLDIHADTAVVADTVVAGRLPGSRREHVAEGLDRALTDHAMDSYGIDFVVTGARFIRRDFRIVYERAVTHFRYLLLS